MTDIKETAPGQETVALDRRATYARVFSTRLTWVYLVAAGLFHMILLAALTGLVFALGAIILVRLMVRLYVGFAKTDRAPLWYVAFAGALAGAMQASYLLGRFYLALYFWPLMIFAVVLFASLAMLVHLSVPHGLVGIARQPAPGSIRRIRRGSLLGLIVVPTVLALVLEAYATWTVAYQAFLSPFYASQGTGIWLFYLIGAAFIGIPIGLGVAAILLGVNALVPRMGLPTEPGRVGLWARFAGVLVLLGAIVLIYLLVPVAATIGVPPGTDTLAWLGYGTLAVANLLGGLWLLLYDTRWRLRVVAPRVSMRSLLGPMVACGAVVVLLGITAGGVLTHTERRHLAERYVAPITAGLALQPDGEARELPVSFMCLGSDIFIPTCPGVEATWRTRHFYSDVQVRQIMQAVPGRKLFPTDTMDMCDYRDQDKAQFCRINGKSGSYYFEFTEADYGGTGDYVISFTLSESDQEGIQCQLDNNCETLD